MKIPITEANISHSGIVMNESVQINNATLLKFIILSGLALMAVAETICFYVGVFPSLETNILILFLLTLWGLAAIKIGRLSLLPRLMIILYSLPFSTLMGYFFIKDYIWWPTLLATELIQNRLLMVQMVAIGIIGLIGLLLGMWGGALFLPKPSPRHNHEIYLPTLPKSLFVILLLLGLFLSWLSAPSETIFTAPYASEGIESIADKINFPAAFTVSYCLLILLFLDGEREIANLAMERWKKRAVIGVTLFIVIYLQLLRGDRESMGLMVALLFISLTSYKTTVMLDKLNTYSIIIRYKKIIVCFSLVIVIFLGIGGLRFALAPSGTLLSNFSYIELIFMGFSQNTWTAGLLSQLGLASEYHHGGMEYLYGSTYMDYLLSLPPGVISQMLGYVRPIEPSHGPAWWYVGLTSGGILPDVVPFKNFGPLGVLIVLTLYGFLIAWFEQKNLSGSFWGRLQYGSVVVTSFLWFWYGDMNIIRGLMIAFLLWVTYIILTQLRPTSAILPPSESRLSARD